MRRALLSPSGPLLPALVCAALVVALAAELSLPADRARPPAAGVVPAEAVSVPTAVGGAVLPAEAAFVEIAERPLFSPGRRPATAVVIEEAPLEATPAARRQSLQVTVVGIVTGPRSFALVRTEGGRIVPVAEGEELRGWTLAAIEPLQVVFRRDGEEVTVVLQYRVD